MLLFAFLMLHHFSLCLPQPGNIFLKAGHYKLGDFGLVTCIGNGGVGQYEEEGDTRYMSADLLLPGPKDLTKVQ